MPGSNRNSNQLVVPQANAALDQMKYEFAQELGIALPQDGRNTLHRIDMSASWVPDNGHKSSWKVEGSL